MKRKIYGVREPYLVDKNRKKGKKDRKIVFLTKM